MRSRRFTFRAAAVGAALAAMAYGLVAPGAARAAQAGQVPLPGDAATAVASGPIVSAGVPGGCVDDYQVATYHGAPVDVWPCNGGQSQIWTLMTDGTIQINGMCLTEGGVKPDPSSPARAYITLALFPCNLASAGGAQKWTFNGAGQLADGNGGCADDVDGSTGLSGIGLVLNNCSGAATQKWTEPVYGEAPQVGFTGGDVSISLNDGGLDPATVQQAISTLIPQGDNLPVGSSVNTIVQSAFSQVQSGLQQAGELPAGLPAPPSLPDESVTVSGSTITLTVPQADLQPLGLQARSLPTWARGLIAALISAAANILFGAICLGTVLTAFGPAGNTWGAYGCGVLGMAVGTVTFLAVYYALVPYQSAPPTVGRIVAIALVQATFGPSTLSLIGYSWVRANAAGLLSQWAAQMLPAIQGIVGAWASEGFLAIALGVSAVGSGIATALAAYFISSNS